MRLYDVRVAAGTCSRDQARRLLRDARKQGHTDREVWRPQECATMCTHLCLDRCTLGIPTRGATHHGTPRRKTAAHVCGGCPRHGELDRDVGAIQERLREAAREDLRLPE